MKLTEYIKSITSDEIPKNIRQLIGNKLSDEHFKLLGERPIKTPEFSPYTSGEIMTCDYPEWFLNKVFDIVLDDIFAELQNKMKNAR